MYIPLGLAIICVLLGAFGYLLLIMFLLTLESKKPSNLSDRDVRRIEQSLDQSRMENARRKVQALNDITLN